jgi:hypothetical protein
METQQKKKVGRPPKNISPEEHLKRYNEYQKEYQKEKYRNTARIDKLIEKLKSLNVETRKKIFIQCM